MRDNYGIDPDLVTYFYKESTFLNTIYVHWWQIEGFRNWGIEELRDWGIEGLGNRGIEELKDQINKLKEIEFLQFLNS
jgi:hypothetical protein